MSEYKFWYIVTYMALMFTGVAWKLNTVVENQETIMMTQEINMIEYCEEMQFELRDSEKYE